MSLNHVSTAAFVPFISSVIVYIKSLIHLVSRIYGTNFQLVPPATVLGPGLLTVVFFSSEIGLIYQRTVVLRFKRCRAT